MAPIKPIISLAEFDKIDVRVGRINSIKSIDGYKKLLCFTVDFGEFTREIISAIKQERSSFENLLGKQALFLVNIAPKEIAGIKSEGMILDLGYRDGISPTSFVFPEFSVSNGTRLG